MFLKWFSRIFHQKVFNKRIHQMVKNALHKFFRMIFMRSQKLTSNNFDDLTWQKKMERWKNWVQPTRKGKCAVVPLSSSFSCFINKIASVQNKFLRWTLKYINFFLPHFFFFFLFRSLSSAGCISVRESLSFQNNYFVEEAKIIIKLLQTQKINDLVKCKVFPSNKVVSLNAMFFDTQRNFFFSTLALFEWLNWWRKNVLSCRQDSRFRRLPFFCQSCIQCWKKKDWRQKLFLCFL